MTTEQEARLIERVNLIEETLNDVLTILNKTTTASTISKVITLFETELDDIKSRLSLVEDKVESLEEDNYDEET